MLQGPFKQLQCPLAFYGEANGGPKRLGGQGTFLRLWKGITVLSLRPAPLHILAARDPVQRLHSSVQTPSQCSFIDAIAETPGISQCVFAGQIIKGHLCCLIQ